MTEKKKVKILAFAGSARRDSFNKKLIKIAADAALKAGAEVERVDFADFVFPLYNGDLEAASGIPAKVQEFKQKMILADGFLISAPEYNSSITPLLKNAIDWASRPAPGETPLVCFKGKTAVLMSASPGALGGLRGLVHVRAILENIGCMVLPEQVAVSKAMDAFSEDGKLKDPNQEAMIAGLSKRLTEFLEKMK